MTTYSLRHADGSNPEYGISEKAALSQIADKYGVDVDNLVTHDDGQRILIWRSEEAAENDPGTNAVAELIPNS